MSEDQQTVRVRSWLAAPLPADVAHSIERLARAEDVQHIAIMPDVHLASDVCVGVALATRTLIYPAAVGNDIGCGMAAIGFAADADLLADERAAAHVLAGMYERIPAIKYARGMVAEQLPKNLQEVRLSDPGLEKLKMREGRYQLGTLGRGNHFVELQADEDNRLWLIVHSGSRGMGQAIAAAPRGPGPKSSRRWAITKFRSGFARGAGLSGRPSVGHRLCQGEPASDSAGRGRFAARFVRCDDDPRLPDPRGSQPCPARIAFRPELLGTSQRRAFCWARRAGGYPGHDGNGQLSCGGTWQAGVIEFQLSRCRPKDEPQRSREKDCRAEART